MMHIHANHNSISLQSLLGEKTLLGVSLSEELCYSILVQVCKGLAYVHKKGFLHNDLKVGQCGDRSYH